MKTFADIRVGDILYWGAIVIGEHKTVRRHWYDFICLGKDEDMINYSPYKFSAYDNGIALEGFEWLDIIEKKIK